jgi:Xaa-Pro aminopeptidase
MTTTLYAQRRARVAAAIGRDGIAIIPTAAEHPRNRDSDFLYRHDSYFYYLSGFTEPNAWLVITGDGRSTLFCQPKDLEREIWDGFRLGPDAAPDALGRGRRPCRGRAGRTAAQTAWRTATPCGTRLPSTRGWKRAWAAG